MSALEGLLDAWGVCGDERSAVWHDDDWLPHCAESGVGAALLVWLTTVCAMVVATMGRARDMADESFAASVTRLSNAGGELEC